MVRSWRKWQRKQFLPMIIGESPQLLKNLRELEQIPTPSTWKVSPSEKGSLAKIIPKFLIQSSTAVQSSLTPPGLTDAHNSGSMLSDCVKPRVSQSPRTCSG